MTLDAETTQLLKDSAVEWLQETASVRHFRALRDTQGIVQSDETWRGMTEMGWPGMLVPEASGGSGLGMSAMGVVVEQTGRNLTPSPLVSTAVAAVAALTHCEQTAFSESLLARIASGECKVAVAVDEQSHHNPEHVQTTATAVEEGWVLDGRKVAVAGAMAADLFLVSARCEDDAAAALYVVPSDSVSVDPLHLIDSGDHGILTLTDVSISPEAKLIAADESYSLIDRVLDYSRIALAMEMLGTASAAFDMSIDYLKIREQFGQIIGTFQALQHRAAFMHVELELARSAVEAALMAIDDADPDLPALACQAKVMATDTLHLISNETIQLHGGIGMTDEHDAGLFLKRARVLENLYGGRSYLTRRFAALRGF